MKPCTHEDARKTVGIWIRVSTEDQARGESPAVHEKRARLYAEAKGWDVHTVYDLAGVSGKAVMEHPEAKRMLADMRKAKITGLIFSKLARLARNTKELLEFAEEFKKHGADLISLHESIDTSTPAGRLFYTMIAAMAQWEREEIAERVAASIPIRAKMGKPIGGKPPFGYRREGDKVVPHPDEAPVRKLLYELYIEHRRKKSVARILNERGYRTSNGSKFTNTTVNRLIADPTAKGILRVNYSKADPSGTGRVVLKPESEWVIHQIEPIVSEETWNRANAIRESTKKKPNTRKPVHLFAGLVHCHCGAKMYVPSRNPRYVCWTCKNRIPVEDLEAIYHAQLKGFLFSEEQITRYREDQDAAMNERQEKIALLERERDAVKREMDQVYRAYIDGGLTSQALGSRYKPLEERLNQLEDTIPAEQAALDVLRIHALSGQEVLQEVRDLHTRWPSLSKENKRSIVEAITETIIVSKDEVDIRLHYVPDTPPPSSSPGGNGSNSPHANPPRNNLPKSPGANFSVHQALDGLGTDASKGTQSFGLVRGRL
ncbi:MAG: recombinase family protein [Rhizomicrobium sp.]